MGVASYWDIYSGLYFFPSKHKALERVIDLISHNIRRKHFGHNPLCPTGPYVLGKAIAQTCEADEIFVGRSEIIERPFLNPNDLRFWHCLLAGNKVIAEKRKGRTGLAEYGINEGNNYQDLWNNNDIYI